MVIIKTAHMSPFEMFLFVLSGGTGMERVNELVILGQRGQLHRWDSPAGKLRVKDMLGDTGAPQGPVLAPFIPQTSYFQYISVFHHR